MSTSTEPRPSPAEPAPAGSGSEREFTVKARSQRQQVLSRFFHDKRALSGIIIFGLLVLMAFVGPLFYTWDEDYLDPQYSAFESGPGIRGHVLGEANLGRDLLALIMVGTQRSLYIALIVMIVGGIIGLLIGAVAGYFGGRTDNLLMRLIDFLLTIPSLIFLTVVVSSFPAARAFWAIGLFLAVFGWFDLARLVRGSFLSLREREFVEAAHALGASNSRIIFRHLIPNASGTIIVWATLSGATAVGGEAVLSYLGYGVSSGGYSLGRLVSDGVAAATTRPWMFYFPGITLILIVLSINLIGDGIRDAIDPSNARVRA